MTKSPREQTNSLLSALREQRIEADQFCHAFMEIVATADCVSEKLLDNDFYNHIFDLCVRIEDDSEDVLVSKSELESLAGRLQ